MYLNRSKLVLASAAAVICLVVLVASSHRAGAAANIASQTQKSGSGGLSRLPKLFNFVHFKEHFGKSYHSFVEDARRKVIFMACAFRAYVSAMNFKFRRSDYHLAVNEYSDSTPAEQEARENKAMVEGFKPEDVDDEEDSVTPTPGAEQEGELPEFLPAEGENVEVEVAQLLEKHASEPGYKELLQQELHSRRKRSAQLKPRDLSLDELIQPGIREQLAEAAEERAAAAQATRALKSNNPNYEPPELMTRGLNDNFVELRGLMMRPRKDSRSVGEQLKQSLDKLAGEQAGGASGADSAVDQVEGNVMYVDHSKDACMNKPRAQGNCGSCYAFAAVALMEWLFCKQTGMPGARFSEQYIVDCGKNRPDLGTNGCHGDTGYTVFDFIENFGLETLSQYPYEASEGVCPYDDEANELASMGFVRMHLGAYTMVHRKLWHEALEHGPLYVAIASPLDYQEYASGVHSGHNCKPKPSHAQLLVGHGREDGKDFWLMRNSFGTGWGEQGYFKLAKDAPKRCFNKYAFAVGTANGGQDFVASPDIVVKEIRDARQRIPGS